MECSGSVGRALDLGSNGCYFKNNRSLEQDTFIHGLVLFQPRKTRNCPGMIEICLTEM